MQNRFLFFLYSIAPNRFKSYFLNVIVKTEGGQMYSTTLRKVYKKLYNVEVGYGSYGGCFNRLNNLPSNITFGNYCSIAQNIRIFRANHPTNHFTSHPLLYNPVAGFVKTDQLSRPHLSIGNDVWIGEFAVILPKVNKIGNGAIIGAGAIVTKDVEPYAIVVGNPARVIGKRFESAIIDDIEKTKWWDLEKDELIPNIDSLNRVVHSR